MIQKGPEFRTGTFESPDGVSLLTGDAIKMVKEDVLGNKDKFSVNHPEAIDNIKVGAHVLVDNALLDLEVISKEDDCVILKALNNGVINSHKTLNVPGINLKLPFISAIDKDDIEFAAKHPQDYLALIFCKIHQKTLKQQEELSKHLEEMLE